MPSTTRITRQKHRKLRNFLNLLVGHAVTDAQQKYMPNIHCNDREKKRYTEREKKADKKERKLADPD